MITTSTRRRALLSVSDKNGLVEFAKELDALGFALISTGGTAQTLRQAGLEVSEVAEVTGFPELLDGRVKTLHPRIHGGLLGRRDSEEHLRQMQVHGIEPIDLVVVNLYPFEKVAAQSAPIDELIENIDIGGPAMLRSAAKNSDSVAVITDPEDYIPVLAELKTHGQVMPATRRRLAQRVFARTAAYDALIASTLEQHEKKDDALPARLQIQANRVKSLRYGENPHQRAALYLDANQIGGIAQAEILSGKELSYNNLVDAEAAWDLVQEFEVPAVAIIKHTNPAGCAQAATLLDAYRLALACDPVSAFGGVVGVNRAVDGATAEAIAGLFVECIAAPEYSPEALATFSQKKNLRLLRVRSTFRQSRQLQLRAISGGWLVQDADRRLFLEGGSLGRVVTRRAPTAEEEGALRFAWMVCKHVKSNAIVFARAGQTLAVGAGQMSRVDSVRIAAMKAQLPLRGSVVASDAFFPFPDGIEESARQGATAVIQPGGSVRDQEGIDVCDRAGLAMIFTGMRHFRH